MNLPVDTLKELHVGEFFIQIHNKKAKKIKFPKMLLGNNNAMTNFSW